MYKLWVNVDDSDNIANAYGGLSESIVAPIEEYQFYFEVSDVVFKNIGSYQVINNELVKRA